MSITSLYRLELARGPEVPGDGIPGVLRLFSETAGAASGVHLAQWFTLERIWKDNARFESCIPEGEYHLIPRRHGSFYRRYKEMWGHQHGFQVVVPGTAQCGERADILLHRGNTSASVRGCIAIGTRAGVEEGRLFLYDSTAGYRNLYDVLSRLNRSGQGFRMLVHRDDYDTPESVLDMDIDREDL